MDKNRLKLFGIKRIILIRQIDNWSKGKRYIARTLFSKYLIYEEDTKIVSIYRLKGYKRAKVV
ncbi:MULTISPECIES: hypothetical protein [Clostridium]|uniref:hypothetical protein n=1 Tax=Clostridium TaxID=1485 RepID=UPI00069E3BA8|nr:MULTISPECIES: hypothetical protein [Clostridium]KOF55802.1 hypothetical protein AGR56_18615 [Clostridium sp. DMHC 10]MCD2349034.1 hypothetical protein [Clostridium guangxiense]